MTNEQREALAFGAEALDFMHRDRREHFADYPEDFDHEEPDWGAYDRAAAILRDMATTGGKPTEEGVFASEDAAVRWAEGNGQTGRTRGDGYTVERYEVKA